MQGWREYRRWSRSRRYKLVATPVPIMANRVQKGEERRKKERQQGRENGQGQSTD